MPETESRSQNNQESNHTKQIEEPKMLTSEPRKYDMKNDENSSEIIEEKNTLTEIRGLFSEIYQLNKEDVNILNEIKEILVNQAKTNSNANAEESLLKDIEHFKDNKVWVTKKTRMESEARMNSNNIFTLIVVNYYTLVVLSLSILGLVISDDNLVENITVLTLIASVALFGISLFVSLFGYKEKAISYKQCYLDLTKIESQCQDLILEDSNYTTRLSKFNEIKKEYNHILEKTDNHSFVDRLVYLKNNKKLTTFEDQVSYRRYKLSNLLFKIVIFIIPIIAFILLFVWK